MSNLSIFLGCVAPHRYPGIEMASRRIMSKLGVELDELEGASCCPAPGVFRSFDQSTWLALASRNITLSEELGDDILTICNGCFGSLSDANHILKHNETLKDEVNEKLKEVGHNFKGTQNIRHIVEYLFKEYGINKIKELVENPLTNLRVGVHYGCHLIKPTDERGFGSQDDVTFFDELVDATGAESIDYENKMMCCGAGGGARTAVLDLSLQMTDAKLEVLDKEGVDCIIDACPFCHLQYDVGQLEVNKKFGKNYKIPVLHYSQLLGLAFGFTPEELGIDKNFVDCSALIEKLNKKKNAVKAEA